MKKFWNLLLDNPLCMLFVWMTVTLGLSVASNVRAQAYRDVMACTLTSNAPIEGTMIDGVCTRTIRSATTSRENIMVLPAPVKCPAGTEKVLVPGRVKCARGLVDPE